jgi:hypothetical protein
MTQLVMATYRTYLHRLIPKLNRSSVSLIDDLHWLAVSNHVRQYLLERRCY